MIMDWDSHINVEYSGSAYCALYLYKYCHKGATRKERIDLGSEQEHDSLDEIKLFIYCRIMCSMAAVWHNHPAELDALKCTDFLTKYNTSAKLPKYYEDCLNTLNNISID